MEGCRKDVFNSPVRFCGRLYRSAPALWSLMLETNFIAVEAIANGVAEVAKYDAGAS